MSMRTVLSSPAEVVAVVPALLGFHPRRSLVLLFLSTDQTLQCTLRLDLGTPMVEVHRHVHDLASRAGTTRLLLLAYPESLAGWIDSQTEDEVLDLADQLREAGVEVVDLVVVCEGRWWSMSCTDPDCCPVGGRPVPATTTTLEAELVGAGRVAVAADRDEVLARYRLRPELTPDAEVLAVARDSVPSRLGDACDRALAVLCRLAPPCTPAVDEAARAELMWLLQDVTVRDWTLAHLILEQPDPAGIEALVTTALAAPDALRPRLAGAAAAALLATGDSSVGAWALVDHAGPDSLAQLVAAAIDACIAPTMLQDVFRDALPLIEQRLEQDIRA